MNLLSLTLGIAALVFAVHSVQVKGCLICSTASGFCCSAALLCQLLDTAHARVVCAAVLLMACTVLNVLALVRSRKKGCETCS